ncbi:MAG: alpha/beta hydrolase [Saprospiraceae bacterium]|nr:alpha/beta hydrolase [Saprospiraceae bacterium]
MKPKNWLLVFLLTGALTSCTKEKLINDPGNLVPETVMEDPSIPAITVNGATLHSEAFGHPDSTMLVVVHGGPGSDYRSLLNIKDLALAGYRVIFYDQRGSGLSERFDADYYESLEEEAVSLFFEDLRGVIAHYRTRSDQRVMLIGDSWGGMLCAGYTGKYPGEVDGLVVSEPGGLRWDDVVDYVKRSRSFKIWGEAFNDATYLDQFITGDKNEHQILDYKAALNSSKNEITGEGVLAPNLFWRSGAVCNAGLFKAGFDYEPDFSIGLEQFEVPVLFIYTEKNTAYQLSWAQRISAVFNQVQLFEITGIGHSEMYTVDHVWTQVTKPALLTYFQSLQ